MGWAETGWAQMGWAESAGHRTIHTVLYIT